MKYRIITNTIIFLTIVLLFSGCAKNDQVSSPDSSSIDQTNTNNIIDLTKVSPSMLYSEVYLINMDHEKYYGKTIIIKGKFNYYKDDSGENEYFSVLVSDDDGCCEQGLEFILNGNLKYPDDYPKENTEITVSGTLEKYNEGETEFYHLVNASILTTG